LKAPTKKWWNEVVSAFELEEHHLKLLVLAAESWDRCVQAREALAEHGLTFVDRFGSPHARPEVSIERDSRIGFARMLRELALDIEPPAEVRLPRLLGSVGGR
jgi:phage terminase small subunit